MSDCSNNYANDLNSASVIGVIPMMVFLTLSSLTGLSMYAYFEGCDPVKSGKLDKTDQIVPYLALNLFQPTPGMAGLFVSAAYSGMLRLDSKLFLKFFLRPVCNTSFNPIQKNFTVIQINYFMFIAIIFIHIKRNSKEAICDFFKGIRCIKIL